ncbi:MAG: sigma-54 dependent transcriptional regulator [Simkaniaceae bacterium]|nr:sigma-54 dependent transcriptional regulator [Simkaniaceae bacterium]
MKRVLIIENHDDDRELLGRMFSHYTTCLCETPKQALRCMQEWGFDLVFSYRSGIDLLLRSGRLKVGVPLILLKERGEPDHEGVVATLEKPLVEREIKRVLRSRHLAGPCKVKMIAESPHMKRVLETVVKVSPSRANIFLSGESGTGKEVIADLIHAYSKRAFFPFIRVNCASLPGTLIESEFFGHEKGAFTGAHARRIGRFEAADGGTLLLDEVSEIPPPLQAKLLRVVQEMEVERVGGRGPIPVDVRIISTSNREMEEAIRSSVFRSDLYYRLNMIAVTLAPLRERREDILPLAHHFLDEACAKNELPPKILSVGAEQQLRSYLWPGNIRELRNVIECAAIVGEGGVLREEDLSFPSAKRTTEPFPSLKALEKTHILKALKLCGSNRTHAARKLGIHVRTLRNKLKMHAFNEIDERGGR